MRITAQLIDTQNDRHLWSETYDRDLVDIFAIQDEIATAIVTALKEQLGMERTQLFYPVASIQRIGGMLVGGSDWDVTTLNPLYVIEGLVRRQDPDAADGPELSTNERIDLDTALAIYTRNAAFIMRQEKISGTIEVSKKADLVVLDRNLFTVPATQINEAQVELTMLGGKVVYSAKP